MKRLLAVLVLVAAALLPVRARAASRDVKVLVPDGDNLQYMSFWLAKAAGYFADEGLDVTPVIPKNPQETRGLFERGETNVAVLPPPVYLELIAAKFPLVLVCNLLKNDPINLVVSDRVWNERKLSRDVPVKDRLAAIKGIRLGVAPHPPARARAMFAAYGMDADKDVALTIVRGQEQNDAFARGEVDALFAHTPYVERALVDQGAHLLVHISGGEVPALAARQIHALVFTKQLAEGSPDTAAAMTRAIARAEALVHADRAAASAALARDLKLDPRHVTALVDLYEPAIPLGPDVSADGFAPALAFFPSGRPTPSLAGIDTSAYVAPSFAHDAAKKPAPTMRWLALALAGVALVVVVITRRRRAARAREI